MLIKNFEDCEKLILAGKDDPTIQVEVIEMLRPADGAKMGYNIAYFAVPQGCRTDRYTLKTSTETIFVRSGKASIELDGVLLPLTDQQVVHIPPGVKRCIKNRGTGKLEYHSIAEPVFSPNDSVSEDKMEVKIIQEKK